MLETLLPLAKEKIHHANSLENLDQLKTEFFGKQSKITEAMKQFKDLNDEDKKNLGQKINHLRQNIQKMLDDKLLILEDQALTLQFEREKLDLTIPHRPIKAGSIHPISQAIEEMIEILAQYGFSVEEGPNIESSWYNFTALNIGEDHPARQMHDTFYLNSEMLLRTQTSPIQIRTMEKQSPPIRIIAPGRTYRCDSDMTHTPMFHQLEGLVVDADMTMGHLKYIIIEFIKQFFETDNIEVRFRPSFFPFTEPSAEVDIKMKNSDKWLEVLGCGMVNPKVLANVNIDATKFQGFAFGFGVDRFAMLKYGIKDLRQFFESDICWLKHYGFSPYDVPSIARGLSR